jgi:hypothetical protein
MFEAFGKSTIVPMAVVTAYILLALAVYLSSAWLLVMLS